MTSEMNDKLWGEINRLRREVERLRTLGGVSRWQTYTPIFGGFSTAPSIGRVAYVLIGKMCILTVFTRPGTSNANYYTMTAPFTAANISGAEWRASLAFYISDGSTVRGQGDVRLQANSNEIAIATASGFTSWDTNGNKSANFQLIYEVA
jgi:hypothetical protein